MTTDRHILPVLLLFLLVGPGSLLTGQDHEWWNQKHRWDGTTPWNQYIIPGSAYMGPNALPVPDVRSGVLPREGFFELGLDGHFGTGDLTGNGHTRFFVPLFSPRAGLSVSFVPLEVYRTDTLTRDLRRSREYDGRGTSVGDVYFSTLIHLVRERGALPDILLGINLKTASGNNFHAARHTDTPGYYFDLSAGKSFIPGPGPLTSLRAYAMVGFYVYQTSLINYMQNDAFLYGAGVDLVFGSLKLEQQLGGYTGYLDMGDSPLVYRLCLHRDAGSRAVFSLRFQHGFIDFPYTSLRISTMIKISSQES